MRQPRLLKARLGAVAPDLRRIPVVKGEVGSEEAPYCLKHVISFQVLLHLTTIRTQPAKRLLNISEL